MKVPSPEDTGTTATFVAHVQSLRPRSCPISTHLHTENFRLLWCIAKTRKYLDGHVRSCSNSTGFSFRRQQGVLKGPIVRRVYHHATVLIIVVADNPRIAFV